MTVSDKREASEPGAADRILLASARAGDSEILPIARLVLLFHAGTCPASDPTLPRDKAEARNLRLLHLLRPANHLGLAGVAYKPPRFIHPFDRYYSLPGYLDQIVLPYFYRAVDCTAKSQSPRGGAEFLAFIYVFFLLVHPLVDGNGRVARNLLDYYNAKLSLRVQPVWNQESPKFARLPFHRSAFRKFFEKELALPPLKARDPYDVLDEIRGPVARMADHMIHWAVAVSLDATTVGKRPSVRAMAAGIRRLASRG